MKLLSKSVVVVTLGVAAAGVAAWWWPRRGTAEAPDYRTTGVARGSIVQTVTATGTLSPLTTVSVGTQVSGTIASLHADFNDPVKTGQLLAEIEPSTYQARVAQAEADLDSANATLELRRVNARRATELFSGKLISQADYDQAVAELRQQEAAVRIKEGSLASARVDLDRTRIYSPIDGVVISREVDTGQTVQANFSAPELFTIAEDLRRMEISASVSEADIGGVAPGQTVAFTVDAYPNRTFMGAVKQVRANAATSSNVVTYPTIITVANDDLKLLPGMTASVTITTAERRNILRVPNAAIRFSPQDGAVLRPAASEGPRVRIMRPEGAGNGQGRPPEPPAASQNRRVVHVIAPAATDNPDAAPVLAARLVETGITDGAYTEVISGLEEGDQVVTGVSTAVLAAAKDDQTRNPFMPTPPRRVTTGNRSAGGGPPPPP